MSDHPENEDFAQLVLALEPWLPNLVIIGGWAHRLYRLHPSAQRLPYLPLMTLDTDVAVPTRLPVIAQNIRDRLVANGFEEERLGQDNPPATHYRLGASKTGFYAEFLTPLSGATHRRDGKTKATRRIAGVISQQLRHLEILLYTPWVVGIGRSNGFSFGNPREIQVASPASFLAHKILIHGKRARGKFAKNILYIHDTLELFAARLEDINREWDTKIKPRIHPKSARKIERAANELFGEVTDAIREAARMADSRKLSAEVVRERCSIGLKRIFGR
jgi:Nucleotidyltransferase